MVPQNTFAATIIEHRMVLDAVAGLEKPIEYAVAIVVDALRGGGKVMFCGNGGSAADGQHLAAELTGRFVNDRRALAGLALSTDSSALTCIGNDYGFDDVFARQVAGLGRRGDGLVAISTSGNSRNVVKAVETATALGIATVGLLGRDGGALAELCSVSVVVPSDTTARIQEMHIMIGHHLCARIEASLGLA